MPQNRLLVGALAALLVAVSFAGVLGVGVGATGANAPAPQANRTLQVNAVGHAEADPDVAVLRVAVVTRGDDAQTARQRLAENVSDLRAALSDAGLSDDQITTAHYGLDRDRPERKAPSGESEATYRAVHAFEIRLTDLDAVGETIDTAVASGATQVHGVEFTLSEEKRRELRRDAIADAMANARGQAEALATAGDLTVTDLRHASTGNVGYRPYRVEMAAATSGAGGATTVDSGAVTVTVRVNAVFGAETA
ncbi:MAG: SIMPL domain-containing protein [Halobacteriaceae archaeon]